MRPSVEDCNAEGNCSGRTVLFSKMLSWDGRTNTVGNISYKCHQGYKETANSWFGVCFKVPSFPSLPTPSLPASLPSNTVPLSIFQPGMVLSRHPARRDPLPDPLPFFCGTVWATWANHSPGLASESYCLCPSYLALPSLPNYTYLFHLPAFQGSCVLAVCKGHSYLCPGGRGSAVLSMAVGKKRGGGCLCCHTHVAWV